MPAAGRRFRRTGSPATALRVFASDRWLDEAVIAVVPSIQDRHPFGLCVDEYEELVAEVVHRADGVLFEHRLDREALGLDDPHLAPRTAVTVREPPEDLLLLLRPGTQTGLLLVVDGLPLDLVDDVVERLLVARSGGSAPKHLTVDHEADFGDMGGGGTLVLLSPQLDRGIRLVVQQPLDPSDFPFRVVPHAVRDLGVL